MVKITFEVDRQDANSLMLISEILDGTVEHWQYGAEELCNILDWFYHCDDIEMPEEVAGLVWRARAAMHEASKFCPTSLALDEGDSSAPEGESTPEVLSAGQALSKPALRQ